MLLPTSDRAGAGRSSNLQSKKDSIRCPRLWHGSSGGALPNQSGIVISLARMNRILEVDLPNARVVVEPGVINADITQRVSPHGYFYAPDPSSLSVCSIGGNVAENAGGALPQVRFHRPLTCWTGSSIAGWIAGACGGKTLDRPGYDLSGIFVGSEGTLGIATRITFGLLSSRKQFRPFLLLSTPQ